jgi:STE24 endopeptidase
MARDHLRIDEDRQRLAAEYARLRLRLRAVSTLLSIAALLILGPLGLAPWLRDVVEHATAVWPLQVALFFFVIGAAWSFVQLPLVYVGGFRLPHRYGLSNQTLREWIADMLKGAAVGVVLGAIAVEALYGFLRLTPATWWIWTALAYTVLSVVLTASAPVLILPLFFKLQPIADEDLVHSIRTLAAKAGTQVRDVCHINLSSKTPAANAAVIGLGRTRKIVLGDTLTSAFPVDEVEVVVAHELGHHVHRDIARGVAMESAGLFAGFFLANLALHAAASRWASAGVWDLGLCPVLAATLGIWESLSGIAGRAYSRRRESAADAYSLRLSGQAQAFINSEIRLTNQNLGWLRPPAWIESVFYTHPAPWRRIAMGERFLADRPLER